MKKFTSILLAAIVLGFSLQSCSKDEEVTPDNPQLPPESSFVMDFSDFEDNDSQNSDSEKKGNSSKSAGNWAAAVLTVGVWNLVIGVHAAVPIASFKEAFNHEAKYDKDLKKWVREYEVTVPAGTFTCRLQAKTESDKVKWEMYISKQGGVQDFLWYEGTSNFDRTSGSWTLYKALGNSTKYIGIDWNHDFDKETADIKYTNLEDNGYIQYGITDGEVYDRFYTIDNKANNIKHDIEWNSVTKNGTMKKTTVSDTTALCWDNNLQNIDCE